MNLFNKYGIKEVADVTFYSIVKIGDEELNIPTLHFDTLKIANLDFKTTPVFQNGGYGNTKQIGWSFEKDITLRLEDALCSAASLNLIYGWLRSSLGLYSSIIAKTTVAQKYYRLNYSTYAYKSPELTEEEWEEIFRLLSLNKTVMTNYSFTIPTTPITKDFKSYPYVSEARTLIKKQYTKRNDIPMPQDVINLVKAEISSVTDYSIIEHDNYEVEIIDRFSPCVVTEEDGFTFSAWVQNENIKKFYENNQDQSYVIYYDAKTMQPFYSDGIDIDSTYTLKKNTTYYKWSRTVQRKINDNAFLGKDLIVDTDTFPQEFKIVGETYIREQKTFKDSRYQFIINRAQIAPSTTLSLSAAGEPSVFSIDINVLTPPNELMIEFKQFDVIEDEKNGGTKIKPQITQYTSTSVDQIVGTGKTDSQLTVEQIY